MTELRTALNERKEEFDTHFELAMALEARVLEGEVSLGETKLSARHLLTMKSGLLVHLYNIVEAIMNRTIQTVGQAVGEVSPAEWSEHTLREWLRKNVPVENERNEDSRLEIVHGASMKLLKGIPLGAQEFKKPSGTWSDKLIARFAERLQVDFNLSEEMWRRIASSPRFADQSPMEFLADRRNAIAHGRRSFEEGANDLTLGVIRELADVTLDYMGLATDAFQGFVDSKAYKVPVP
jgi:hypothetical protein